MDVLHRFVSVTTMRTILTLFHVKLTLKKFTWSAWPCVKLLTLTVSEAVPEITISTWTTVPVEATAQVVVPVKTTIAQLRVNH